MGYCLSMSKNLMTLSITHTRSSILVFGQCVPAAYLSLLPAVLYGAFCARQELMPDRVVGHRKTIEALKV